MTHGAALPCQRIGGRSGRASARGGEVDGGLHGPAFAPESGHGPPPRVHAEMAGVPVATFMPSIPRKIAAFMDRISPGGGYYPGDEVDFVGRAS